MITPTTLGAIFLTVAAICIIALVYKRVTGQTIEKRTAKVLAIGISCLVIMAFVAFIPQISDAFWEPEVAPAVDDLPPEQITTEKKGYVIATVQDKYKIPSTMISAATVYVSQSEPISGGAWTTIVSDNTGSTGSVTLTVQGVISGNVYVTAGKTGYYPDYAMTSIPGAQVLDEAYAADLQPVKTGTLSWSLTDNSNAVKQGTENILENVTTSASAYFTLRIYTDNAYMALQNIRILVVRGDTWSSLGASMAPVVLDAAGTSVSTSGDVTLTSEVSGQFSFVGDLTYGRMLEIKITTSTTSAVDGTLCKIYIDDLMGTKDILGGTGFSETVITIRTVA